MALILALFRRFGTTRTQVPSGADLPAPTVSPAERRAIPAAAVPAANPGLDPKQVLQQMLDALSALLPGPAPNVPNPTAIVKKLAETPVGLGNFIGEESRPPLGRSLIKGGRFDALVRFIVFGPDIGGVNDGLLTLQSNLLGASSTLREQGFLKLTAEDSSNPEFDPALNAWRRTADYSVLYEYRYESTDGAESLIVRIPIRADRETFRSPDAETTVVTGLLARWDDLSAPRWVLRGPLTLAGLSARVFIPAVTPTGSVTLLRSFDGAAGAAAAFPSLAEFLAALADPLAPARHAQVTFANLTDFLAQFSAQGAPSRLGDWNLDAIPDEYQGHDLPLVPVLSLGGVVDRLEISYGNGSQPLDQVAVVYLRVR